MLHTSHEKLTSKTYASLVSASIFITRVASSARTCLRSPGFSVLSTRSSWEVLKANTQNDRIVGKQSNEQAAKQRMKNKMF